MLFRVEPGRARDIFLRVGADWLNVVLEPRVNSTVRMVCSSHDAKDLYDGSARVGMQSELREALQDSLRELGVVVDACLLKDVALPKSVAAAVEEKLQAEQRSERMHHVIEAERKEAQRKAIEAKGIADFQRIVAEGVSPELLRWKGIEATVELSKSPNAKVVVIGSGQDGLPLILGGLEGRASHA